MTLTPFEWVQPDSLGDALAALQGKGAVPYAGGIDLLDRIKERLDAPARLVSLRRLPGLGAITEDGGHIVVGAAVTLAALEAHPAIRRALPILAEAAGHAATPQIRNLATLGGNLAQRPRCWYFRSAEFHCKKKGGAECFAQGGDNSTHAIFGNQVCAAPHPSTPATALLALGASVVITGPGQTQRAVPLGEFFVTPDRDVTKETVLAAGEIITAVRVPVPAAGTAMAYTKQVAKQSFDWPLCDVAVVLDLDGARARGARVVLGGVAPAPLRAVEAERALAGAALGGPAGEEAFARAARLAVAGATPLHGNAHKLPILETTVRRTILAAAGRPS